MKGCAMAQQERDSDSPNIRLGAHRNAFEFRFALSNSPECFENLVQEVAMRPSGTLIDRMNWAERADPACDQGCQGGWPNPC